MHFYIFLQFYLLLFGSIYAENINIETVQDNLNTQKINIKINLNNKEKIYKDSISISIADPRIIIDNWSVSPEAVSFFDPVFDESKLVFDKPFIISAQLSKKNNTQDSTEIKADLHVNYLLNTEKKPSEKIFTIIFNNKNNNINNTEKTLVQPELDLYKSNLNKEAKTATDFWLLEIFDHIKKYASNILERDSSFIIKILFAILFGFLLSLTPCIFPMIPITMGILQAEGSDSTIRSFLLALSYTLGVSLTFALMGLAVAYGGIAFGQLLNNPFFILSLVTFLIYLALSMFGIYEFYIPSFLQPRNNNIKRGSLISAFNFGVLSGTMASPCLSPGLALILTVVANLKNLFLGFVLLFAFGIGTALPLLIIGTISSAINLFPRAGTWMVEIKKLFGFLIFALCFYYLSSIISYSILLWLVGEFLLITGIWYLSQASSADYYDTKNIKIFKIILGTILLLSAAQIFKLAYKNQYLPENKISNIEIIDTKIKWQDNLEKALELSKIEKKPIFLVYTTDFCPNCLILEKKILKNNLIQDIIIQKFIPVKLDNIDQLKTIIGESKFLPTPTVLIINNNKNILKEWQNGVPKEVTPEAFAQELENIKL